MRDPRTSSRGIIDPTPENHQGDAPAGSREGREPLAIGKTGAFQWSLVLGSETDVPDSPEMDADTWTMPDAILKRVANNLSQPVRLVAR